MVNGRWIGELVQKRRLRERQREVEREADSQSQTRRSMKHGELMAMMDRLDGRMEELRL